MLSLTACVWEFRNNALWDTHQHSLLGTVFSYKTLLTPVERKAVAYLLSMAAEGSRAGQFLSRGLYRPCQFIGTWDIVSDPSSADNNGKIRRSNLYWLINLLLVSYTDKPPVGVGVGCWWGRSVIIFCHQQTDWSV